jgi:hypothetical protein
VVGCCECGDEPSVSGATELVSFVKKSLRVDKLELQISLKLN